VIFISSSFSLTNERPVHGKAGGIITSAVLVWAVTSCHQVWEYYIVGKKCWSVFEFGL